MNAPVSAAAEATACFHCGEPLANGATWQVELDGRTVDLCCPGCAAATSAIRDFGLGEYYRHRDSFAPRPGKDELPPERYQVYDDAGMLARFATVEGEVAQADLTLAGMSCAACAWLLESRLAHAPGVERFDVHFASRRATVRWRLADTRLSRILDAVATLGYDARPFTPDARRAQMEAETSALLRALGVAALFGMQVMMIAFAFYTGGIEPGMQRFLRWTSLVMSVPVVSYCALPFYRAAWAAVRAGGLVMEVPVALAILLAFAGSVWNTVLDQDAVYFDSVSMFVGLLLASRYLERRARAAASARLEAFTALVPDGACRIRSDADGEHFDTVPAMRLAPGETVLVRAGETIPADGVVSEGLSAVDESILTGEALPQTRGLGARVLGGSVNLESVLRVQVTAVAAESFAGHLAQLVRAAAEARPAGVELSQRAARWFVAAVLLVSVGTAWFWWQHDAGRWFSTTLAVLVVSCPCALAIAVPAALAAAHASLLGEGIAVLDGRALERLADVSHCLFDKTGTLTVGQLALRDIECQGNTERGTALRLACALAQSSNHPVARALRNLAEAGAAPGLTDYESVTGAGMQGHLDGARLALGSAAYMASLGVTVPLSAGQGATPGKEAWLARDAELLARLEFDDRLRDDAPALFTWLHAHAYGTAIVSGDRLAVVEALARACGVKTFQAARTPADKQAEVARLQKDGAVVLMVGDGVNDAPVLAQADVSIAMADSAASARQQASVLLLTPQLSSVSRLLAMARRSRRIMRENLAWAVLYNVIALPLAAAGWLAPWAAALGMSVSSLVVVLNALRLVRR
ncbi:MAG: heavy metal translocating P-type ATPase [Gammaproteobacteria bacterium]|nr:heavy metal translocating P-type ATPase [Gammaproteobacteria bacterium]